MFQPPNMLEPQAKPEEQEKVDSLIPTVPDLGDSIAITEHDPAAFEIDPATGLPKFYHNFDPAIAHLPKSQESVPRRRAYANKKIAVAGALGGTVALLGLGGYAINRALQKRRAPKSDGAPDQAQAANLNTVTESPVATDSAVMQVPDVPATRQFSFDWNNQK